MRRPRLVSIALAAVLVAMLVPIGPFISTANASWVTTQLTNDAHDHYTAVVSGNRVAWIGGWSSSPVYQEVFTDLLGADTAPIPPLTTDLVDHEGPVVSGDRIAWLQWDGHEYQVYTQKVGVDLSATAVTGDPNNHSGLCVSGDRLVWIGYDGWNNQVLTQKIGADATPIYLTTDGNQHTDPGVSGDRVVWTGSVGSLDEIFTQKISVDAAPVRLTPDNTYNHDTAAVSGDRVTWWTGMYFVNNKLFSEVFTEVIGHPTLQVTVDANNHSEASVSGNRLAWKVYDGANYEIYTQRIGVDAKPVLLTTDPQQLTAPKVSGDTVVWCRGANYDVFAEKVGVDTHPVALTPACPYNAVSVSGNKVVWAGGSGSDDQVFLAKPLTTPSIARSPNKTTVVVKRKNKVAQYTLAATLHDTDGTTVNGVRVYLQTSNTGKTKWKNSYTLETNSAGTASKAFTSKKASTLYYRWYAPASTGFKAAYSGEQKVQVK